MDKNSKSGDVHAQSTCFQLEVAQLQISKRSYSQGMSNDLRRLISMKRRSV